MDILLKTNKGEYVSPETEVIEVGVQDWLLDYGGGNPEKPDYPDVPIEW